MMQFHPQQDCLVKKFAFEGLTPNAQTNDLCGDGLCKKKLQQSIDRGSFRKSKGGAGWINSEANRAKSEVGNLRQLI